MLFVLMEIMAVCSFRLKFKSSYWRGDSDQGGRLSLYCICDRKRNVALVHTIAVEMLPTVTFVAGRAYY